MNHHPQNRPSCLALDFDFMLTHFVGGFEGLYDILVRRGVPYDDAKAAEDAAELRGFSVEYYLACARDRGYDITDSAGVTQDALDWLRGALVYYEDTEETLAQWADIPMHLVTFGNPDWQTLKVEAMGVRHSGFHPVTVKPKVPVLRELLRQYGSPVYFLDDDVAEHDAVRDAGISEEDIVTIHVLRSDSPHRNKTPQHTHRGVKSLREMHWPLA